MKENGTVDMFSGDAMPDGINSMTAYLGSVFLVQYHKFLRYFTSIFIDLKPSYQVMMLCCS